MRSRQSDSELSPVRTERPLGFHARSYQTPTRASRGRSLSLDILETRRLMAYSVTLYGLPTGSLPYAITSGPDGNLWSTLLGSDRIARINTSGAISTYHLPQFASAPTGITTGPDNSLWFGESLTNILPSNSGVGRIQTDGSFLPDYSNGISAGANPTDLVTGPDRNVYLTENGLSDGRIAQITPTGAITEFTTSPPGSFPGPYAITNGPDGKLWFTELSANRIRNIDTSGNVNPTSQYALAAPNRLPASIVTGPDGNLWFTENAAGIGEVGRLNPTTGVITEFSVASIMPAGGLNGVPKPQTITVGADGALYFTVNNYALIGRIDTAGNVSPITVPGPANAGTSSITNGPDGKLWFTQINANTIGSVKLPSPLLSTPTVVVAIEGTPQNVVLGQFTDPDAADPATNFSATVTLFDGATTTTLSTPVAVNIVATGSPGQFNVVLPNFRFPKEGPYKISVAVSSNNGPRTTSFVTTTTVANGGLAPSGPGLAFTVPAGTSFAVSGFDGHIANILDSGGLGTTTAYSGTIDWGDGSPTSLAMFKNFTSTPAGETFQVYGTHTYSTPGNYVGQVVVTDGAGGQVMMTILPTVVGPTSSFAAGLSSVAGTPISSTLVAQFTIGYPITLSNYTGTVDFGDGTIVGATLNRTGLGPINVTAPAHTYTTPGNYGVKVTIGDLGNPNIATTIGSASISGLTSFLTSLTPLVVTAGTPTPNAFAIQQFTPGINPSFYISSIDWGDGSPIVQAQLGNSMLTAPPHVYAAPGFYTIGYQIRQTNGTLLLTSGTLISVNAPLTFASTNLTAMKNTPTNLNLAFVAAPAGVGGFDASRYYTLIDYGDGTPGDTVPLSSAVVGGNVFHTHTYATPGQYIALVTLFDNAGINLGATSVPVTVTPVNSVPISINGRLNPSSDSGISNSDGITNVINPNFYGVTDPGATVKLYATIVGTTVPVLVGRGAADASGAWSITTNPLPDGVYAISVTAVSADGSQTASSAILPTSGSTNNLVIDTVSPQVIGLAFTNPKQGQFTISFHDDRSGLATSTLVDGVNYSYTRTVPKPKIGQRYPIHKLSATNFGGPTGTYVVTATVFNMHFEKINAGQYYITVSTNVTDVAGNKLNGAFYGTFPSGNHAQPTTNFMAYVNFDGKNVKSITGVNSANPALTTTSPAVPSAKLAHHFKGASKISHHHR